VEGGDAAPADEREGAPFRRIGIGVGEVLVVGGVGEIAKRRKPMLRLRLACASDEETTDRNCAEGQRAEPRPRRQSLGAPGSLTANDLSTHHTCVKPGVRPGKVAGWP